MQWYPTFLELPASSLSTALKISFWQHLTLANGLLFLPFLGSAAFNAEKLILRNAKSKYWNTRLSSFFMFPAHSSVYKIKHVTS